MENTYLGIDTSFRPLRLDESNITHYKSKALEIESDRCKHFVNRSYQRETDELQSLLNTMRIRIASLEECGTILDAMKVKAESNIALIESSMHIVRGIEHAKRYKKNKPMQSLAQKEAELLAQLEAIRSQREALDVSNA